MLTLRDDITSPDRETPTTAVSAGWPIYPVAILAIIVANDYRFRVRPPSEALSATPDLSTMVEITVYAIVAVLTIVRLRGFPKARRLPAVMVAAMAYVGLTAVSVIQSPFPATAAARVAEFLILLLVTVYAANHASRADLHRLAHWFMVLVAISVLSGLIIRMPRDALQEDRFTWLRLNAVTAGVFVGLAVTIAVTYLFTRHVDRPGPRWRPITYLILLAICAGGLFGTQTRGAIAGVAVSILAVLIIGTRGRRRISIVGVIIFITTLVGLAAGSQILTYLARGESAAELQTLNSRTDLWSLALNAVEQKPLFGWGTGASRGIFLEQIGLGGGHNALINVAVDLGLVGVTTWLLMLVFLLTGLRRIWRYSRPRPTVDLLIVVATISFLLVDSMFDEGLGAPSNVSATWLFISIAWVALLMRPDRLPTGGRAR